MQACVEYFWVTAKDDAASKTRIIDLATEPTSHTDFPAFYTDASSVFGVPFKDVQDTNSPINADCKLEPVRMVPFPARSGYPGGSYLVLCEVLSPLDDTPHSTNTRADLRAVLERAVDQEPWVGFEQEYRLWAVGEENNLTALTKIGQGQAFIDQHMLACVQAGIPFVGCNAEALPDCWEFQVGGPGVDPLAAADYLWITRWLLYRVGETLGLLVDLDPSPVRDLWNGLSTHTNFSTKAMRNPEGGYDHIVAACEVLKGAVDKHMAVYAEPNFADRVAEFRPPRVPCRFSKFRYGVADRVASVRIPGHVYARGHGYLEDRRPCAEADPYKVAQVLLETICLSSDG
tara:strand:+ start:6450 stop:7484 length:1035 start_codon:yes stop_codon:yes gene_type:complete